MRGKTGTLPGAQATREDVADDGWAGAEVAEK